MDIGGFPLVTAVVALSSIWTLKYRIEPWSLIFTMRVAVYEIVFCTLALRCNTLIPDGRSRPLTTVYWFLSWCTTRLSQMGLSPGSNTIWKSLYRNRIAYCYS
jgi:hypothetical protein